MEVYLSEKEIRVIRVALYKHWINMTDDNAEANDKSLQDFADCCHDTWDRFSDLDQFEKSFDELNDDM
ncbi:MAG: hypothetical protein Q4E61_01265 [Alphaproteobacteria bacterium]|nr:hypothetical protein [Alphaproteobacteria bacterium]